MESWMGPWERRIGDDLAALALTMSEGNGMQADRTDVENSEELRVKR
jgi:hypothetical protein